MQDKDSEILDQGSVFTPLNQASLCQAPNFPDSPLAGSLHEGVDVDADIKRLGSKLGDGKKWSSFPQHEVQTYYPEGFRHIQHRWRQDWVEEER